MTAQARVELIVTDVDGIHLGGAMLEEAVGEASGGSAHVEANAPFRIDAEPFERRFQLSVHLASLADAIKTLAERERDA